MDLTTFITLAGKWDDLGWAVRDQALEALDDSDKMDECNPNALRMIRDNFLKPLSRCGDEQLENEAKTQIELIDERLS